MIQFCDSINISSTEKELIINSLPVDWETEILSVNLENDTEILIKINLKTVDDINYWLCSYQRLTNTLYRSGKTCKTIGQKVLYKRYLHCQHNTKHKDTYDPVNKRCTKNTNCPSTIVIALKAIHKRFRGKDKNRAPDPDKPCEIRIRLKHNHSTNSSDSDVLRFKEVAPDTTDKLLNLFLQGHSAATALETLKADIYLNNINYTEILADRSMCPEYQFCYRLYRKEFLNKYETLDFNSEFLKQKVEEYNLLTSDDSAKIISNEHGFVVCFCPPFIKRVHQYQSSSSEIIYVESCSTCEKNGERIYFMLTPSENGGLPLGVIITSTDNVSLLINGFLLLKQMLGNIAFYGRENGPQIFVTDLYLAENNVINSVWPNSKNLLSSCHVLKSVWKWLQSVKNKILASDRLQMFKDFYYMLNASNESDLTSKYHIAKQNSNKYSQYISFLNDHFHMRNLWALCYRPNDYSELILRCLRDKIFQRLKTFNVIQMVHFITSIFFVYFERRLLDVAHARDFQTVFYETQQVPPADILKRIVNLGKNVRLVPNERSDDVFYLVNTDLYTCTCFNGYSDSVCKHVQWACMFVESEVTTKQLCPEVRWRCYFIATGESPPEELQNVFYNKTPTEIENSQSDLDFRNSNVFEETFQDTEPDDLIEMNDFLVVKQKEDYAQECSNIWQNLTQIYNNLVSESPEEMLSVAKTISSRFESVKTVPEFCSALNIFHKGCKRKNDSLNKQSNNCEPKKTKECD